MKSVLKSGSSVPLLLSFALVFGMIVSLLVIQSANADELYGRIRGTATDATGAALPGVQLKLVNTGTNATFQLVSGADGSFEFINLQPGLYKLTASKANFKSFEVTSIKVTQNDVYVQNVTMEIGAVTETVEVAANQAQVEQTSIQLTSDIDAKMITDLPLLNRNFVALQQTLPGVVTPDTRFGNNFATNGSQAQQNSYLVNGNDFNDLPLNSPLPPPNPDTIAEVKMVTNTLNPEFGRNSGAVVNAVTKSGTNNLHGTGFWFYRDSFLQTKNFFQTSAPPIHQNLFGGTVGGPIRKDKMFAFYGLQILRARQPDTNFFGGTNLGVYPTVFTQAQLNGNWTGTTFSTSVIPKNLTITGPAGPCPAGTTWSACFVGGVVPTSNFSALSMQLVKNFVPLPNAPNSTYSFNPITTTKTNQHIGRFDWNITQKDALWFYGYANDSTTSNDIPFSGATLPGFGDGSIPYVKQFTASWNHTFTSNLLNELRLGYTRFNFPTGQPQHVRQPSAVGFPNIFAQSAAGADYPQINITGYFTIGGTSNGPQPRKDQTYQVTENYSWIKGNHSLKMGYDGRKFQVWNPFLAVNDGEFTYNSGTYSTGDNGLDFLLGIPTSYTQGSGSLIIAQAYEHYLYFQDQWKIRSNFTLTYGTGFQIDTPISEYQQGGISRFCFQPGVQSKIFPTGTASDGNPAGAPVGYTVSGDPNCATSGLTRTKYHFGPRIGFAYSPGGSNRFTGGAGKTSIRAGFGIYYNRSEEEVNLQDLGIPPFGLTSTGAGDFGGSPSFPDPWTDINGGGALKNKFPYTPQGAGSLVDFSLFYPMGSGLNTSDRNETTPRAANYNLTLERQLPAATLLRIGYVGATGKRLFTSYSFNPTTPAGVQACLANPACSSNPLGQPVNFPSHYALDASIWGQPGIQTTDGWSHYNALQVTVEKRLSHGLQFLSAYTWSHSLDVSSSFENVAFQLAGSFDPYGRFQNDYGSSAFDVRNRWVISGTYEIPSLHKVWAFAPDRAFGGWQISAFNTLQDGFPLFLEESSVHSLTCSWVYSFYGCPDRPQLVAFPTALDPRRSNTFLFRGKNRTGNYWFNPTDFTDAPLGQLGNVSRGFFRGPGYTNLDMAIEKNTRITEKTSLQLRLEAYNAFNHTNFGNPNNNVDSSKFGQITGIRSFTNSRLVQLGAKFSF